jgi:uncharacterized membrane protein
MTNPLDSDREAPFWHHEHKGESRLTINVVVALVILMQLTLPKALNISFPWFICGIEAALLLLINILEPRRVSSHSGIPRNLSLGLAAAMSAANLTSIARLINELLNGQVKDAKSLLLTGGSIWLTNVIVFALWYWEFDRGGPGARAAAKKSIPDFMFPQMSDPDLAAPHWSSSFFDYLYISFTNSSAFSPTDVLPLTRWAKGLMLLQSVTSLIVVALVVARAVNILH